MKDTLDKINIIQDHINSVMTYEDIKCFNGTLIPINIFFLISNNNHFKSCKQISDGIFTHKELGSIYVQKISIFLENTDTITVFVYMDSKNCLISCQKSAISVNLYDLEIAIKNAKILGIEKLMIQENIPVPNETDDGFSCEVVFSDFDFNSNDIVYKCADIVRNFTVRN